MALAVRAEQTLTVGGLMVHYYYLERDRERKGWKMVSVVVFCLCVCLCVSFRFEEQNSSFHCCSCQSSPHCSKMPSSWVDDTSWMFLLEAQTERQGTAMIHCTDNRLTTPPILLLSLCSCKIICIELMILNYSNQAKSPAATQSKMCV